MTYLMKTICNEIFELLEKNKIEIQLEKEIQDSLDNILKEENSSIDFSMEETELGGHTIGSSVLWKIVFWREDSNHR